MAQVLLDRQIHVLFSYWLCKPSEFFSKSYRSVLFELPMDLTVPELRTIAEYDYGGKKTIFVITLPHIACARFVNLFNTMGWTTVYDVSLDWQELHRMGRTERYDQNVEIYIANNVDVLSTESLFLLKKIQDWTIQTKVQLIPGVERWKDQMRQLLSWEPAGNSRVLKELNPNRT